MISDSTRKLIERFLSKGMDVEGFGFRSLEDKISFFDVFEKYAQSSIPEDMTVTCSYDTEGNMTVYMNKEEICLIEITEDFSTMMCHTFMTIDDPELEFVIRILMAVIGELNSVMTVMNDMLDNIKDKEDIATKKKRIEIPDSVNMSLNKIAKLQKSILSENEKYRLKIINKEKK